MWQLTSPNCYHNSTAKIPRIELQLVSTYFVHKSDLTTCEIQDAGGSNTDTVYSDTKLRTFGKKLRPPASIFESSWRQCIIRLQWACKATQIEIPQVEVKVQKYKQPIRRKNNGLLIISISSTCFGR